MFTGFATLKFEGGALRAMICDDFAKYQRRLFEFETFNTRKMSTAKYGVHITVYNPQFHFGISGAEKYDGQHVSFQYNPEKIHRGGMFHEGYYQNVESDDIE